LTEEFLDSLNFGSCTSSRLFKGVKFLEVGLLLLFVVNDNLEPMFRLDADLKEEGTAWALRAYSALSNLSRMSIW
jgi:hypothetical protein